MNILIKVKDNLSLNINATPTVNNDNIVLLVTKEELTKVLMDLVDTPQNQTTTRDVIITQNLPKFLIKVIPISLIQTLQETNTKFILKNLTKEQASSPEQLLDFLATKKNIYTFIYKCFREQATDQTLLKFDELMQIYNTLHKRQIPDTKTRFYGTLESTIKSEYDTLTKTPGCTQCKKNAFFGKWQLSIEKIIVNIFKEQLSKLKF